MADNLQHIVLSKLQHTVAERHRRRGGRQPSIPYRPDQANHGAELSRSMDGVLAETRSARQALGVHPENLIVLEMAFLGDSQRELLERLGASVVEEATVEQPLASPTYEIVVTFESQRIRASVISALQGVAGVLPVRKSDGTQDSQKVKFQFAHKSEADRFQQQLSSANQISQVTDVQKVSRIESYRLLVEFGNPQALSAFLEERQAYTAGETVQVHLTAIQRATLFDALDAVRHRRPEDYIGPRLQRVLSTIDQSEDIISLDVDLWHPGNTSSVAQAIQDFRVLVEGLGGVVTDGPTAVAHTLFIARARLPGRALADLAMYDRIAWIELPPAAMELDAAPSLSIEEPVSIAQPPPDGPVACVVDSGIVAGHPLLDGLVVDEYDFESGENSVVDRVGHGTHVAGIVAYGDIDSQILAQSWNPSVRIVSAKVMRKGPSGAEFSDDRRMELQVADAIRRVHADWNCRVYNLSFGNDQRPFVGGRQQHLALVLDELARELDVVIVIPTGNVRSPAVPAAASVPEFKQSVLRNLLTDEHRIIDPAPAALALTVGSLAKRGNSQHQLNNPGHREIVGAEAGMPSPFTRSGHYVSRGRGLIRSIKPDLVAFGGNLNLPHGGNQWGQLDVNLGVRSLNHDFQTGRLLRSDVGTSFAAPYITHICAQVEALLRTSLRLEHVSANLIRALVVNSARYTPEAAAHFSQANGLFPDGTHPATQMMGFGYPSLIDSLYSSDSKVTLLAQDNIPDDRFHIYEIELPEDFVKTRGDREVTVTLAFDPPVRGTRQEYFARRLSFEVFSGANPDELHDVLSRGRTSSSGGSSYTESLRMEPNPTHRQWSTVQSARRSTNRRTIFDRGSRKLHVVVFSSKQFEANVGDEQRYAIVVTLRHSGSGIQLHQVLRQRVQQRVRAQVRT